MQRSLGRNLFEQTCQEFRVPKDDKLTPCTHTYMSGGKFCIPEDDLLQVSARKPVKNCIDRQDFINAYTEAFGEPPSVSEYIYTTLVYWYNRRPSNLVEGVTLISRRSDPFFMFFDLDFLFASFDQANWETLQRDLGELVYEEVLKCFEDTEYTREMVMAVTEVPRERCTDDSEKGVSRTLHKLGIHIYFPQIVVNFKEAMALLHVVTVKVREVFGERDLSLGENAWTDVFDPSVYHSGLRDCYTFKTRPCGKNLSFEHNSVYVPKWIFVPCDNSPLAVTNRLSQERGYLLRDGLYDLTLHRLTRVRCSSKEAERYRGKINKSLPSSIGYIPDSADRLVNNGQCKIKVDPLQYPTDVAAQKKFRNFDTLHFTPEDLRRIEACIRENFDETRYQNVQIRSIYAFYFPNREQTIEVLGQPCRFQKIKITLKGDGSRYCFNKGGEHNSNTAYFEIRVRKAKTLPVLEQRCWSPHHYKSSGVVRVCQRYYSGQIHRYGKIPLKVIRLLFHNYQAQPEVHQSP